MNPTHDTAASPINRKRLLNVLQRLLNIYSPSGKEEEAVDLLYRHLRRQGLPVIRQDVDENRQNLIVPFSGKEALLAFIGHLDTVTAYDLEDFGCEIEGDTVRGLGSADMKSGCAAMVEAFTCLWEKGVSELPLTLAMVVGEEEDGDGAEVLVKEFHFPWAIIGEPTDLKPCMQHYSYLEMQLNAQGRRYHASLAKKGSNPVEVMLRILLHLSRYMEKERPEAVYNIRDLFSSGGGFVVPDGCEAWVDVHLPPSAPLADITVEIEELIAREKEVHPSVEILVRFSTVHSGYTLPEKGEVVDALKAAFLQQGLGWEPLAFPSHSDANQLWTAGVKPIILGCGQLELAHSPQEWVSFNQVCTAAEIYYELAVRLLSTKSPVSSDTNRVKQMRR
jgi:acetylornithine deacetylase